MSGNIVNHETIRRATNYTPELTTHNEHDLPPLMKALQAPYEIKADVNLLAVYEQRRHEFMERGFEPEGVVVILQAEYETSLNIRDMRNLYHWAREDYLRTQGIKPEVKPKRIVKETELDDEYEEVMQ